MSCPLLVLGVLFDIKRVFSTRILFDRNPQPAIIIEGEAAT